MSRSGLKRAEEEEEEEGVGLISVIVSLFFNPFSRRFDLDVDLLQDSTLVIEYSWYISVAACTEFY